MLVVLVLLATVAIRVAIVLVVAYLLLSQGPLCPQCGAEMLAIRNRFLDWVVPALQRRWCVECGWNGVVRRASGAPARGSAAPREPRPAPR
jgi:Zn ribbon nucleic-acid-binding protein